MLAYRGHFVLLSPWWQAFLDKGRATKAGEARWLPAGEGGQPAARSAS